MGTWGHLPLAADWFEASPWFAKGAKVTPPVGLYPEATCGLSAVYGTYGVLRIGKHGKEPLRYHLFRARASEGRLFIPEQIEMIEPGKARKPVQGMIAHCQRLAQASSRSLLESEHRQLRHLLKICGPYRLLKAVGVLLLDEGHVPAANEEQLYELLRGIR